MLANEASAAPAPRASTNNYCTGTPDGSGHVSCALGAAAVSGDTILACGRAGSSYDVTAVSDGTNGSYTLGTQFQGNGNVRSRCAWFINTASGTPTIQFTFNNVTGTAQIDVVAISGVATTGSAISETGSTNLGSSTTQTCASATATAANQILWGYLNADSNATSVAPHSSETELHEDPTNHLTQFEYKLTSGAGSVSASWTLGSAAGAACNAVIFDIAPSSPASFDSGPTFAKVDGNTYRMTYDTANATNAYVAVYPLGTATPTAAALIAGTGAHGTATEAATNASDTLDVDVTDGTPFPAYKVCGTAAGAGGNAAVTCDSTQCLDAPTGKQFINCPTGLTSIGVGSAIESLNALITPDWAVGDIPVCDTYTHTVPSGTQQFVFHLSVAGYASYDSGDGSRTYANCDAYDLSAAAYATAASANNDLDWWDQDPAISCSPPFITVLKTNVSMAVAPNAGTIDFSAKCTHPLGDTLTTALTSGTWPAGLSLAANVLSGTPTVENEAGAAETVTATSSVTGGTGAQALTLYPLTTVTVPNCVSLPTTEGNCRAAILAALHNAVTLTSTSACHASVVVGDVFSQSPAGGAQLAPFGTEALSISSPCVNTYRLPSCLQKTLAQCTTIFNDLSNGALFVFGTVSCPSSAYAGGKIFAQSPVPATLVASGSSTTVTYCP